MRIKEINGYERYFINEDGTVFDSKYQKNVAT